MDKVGLILIQIHKMALINLNILLDYFGFVLSLILFWTKNLRSLLSIKSNAEYVYIWKSISFSLSPRFNKIIGEF